jgi:hypothetical protein
MGYYKVSWYTKYKIQINHSIKVVFIGVLSYLVYFDCLTKLLNYINILEEEFG